MTAVWAAAYAEALIASRVAAFQMREALRARCPHVDPDGAQCTADAKTGHDHRYETADLPGFDPTEF